MDQAASSKEDATLKAAEETEFAMMDSADAVSLIDQIMRGATIVNGGTSEPAEGKANAQLEVPEQLSGANAVVASSMTFSEWREGVKLSKDVGRYALLSSAEFQDVYNQIAKLIQSREDQLVQYWEEWQDDENDARKPEGDGDNGSDPIIFESLWEFWQHHPLEKLEKLPDFLACFEEDEDDSYKAEMLAIARAAHLATWKSEVTLRVALLATESWVSPAKCCLRSCGMARALALAMTVPKLKKILILCKGWRCQMMTQVVVLPRRTVTLILCKGCHSQMMKILPLIRILDLTLMNCWSATAERWMCSWQLPSLSASLPRIQIKIFCWSAPQMSLSCGELHVAVSNDPCVNCRN